ncbi:MAG: hypothetical protein JJU06_01380 [Ectothiorhodospiraceae bacterium]|nr:hypothetical protein [Ectothiorhodospiraceae bacterium]MCH8504217.1 hypothetical protein [Ectothiorhodospiraceae bacterium]
MCPACLTSATLIAAGAAGVASAGWLLPLAVRKRWKRRGERHCLKEANHD